MEYLRIALTVLFIIDCIALSVIILMQEVEIAKFLCYTCSA